MLQRLDLNKLLLWYQCILAFNVTFVFFSDLDRYWAYKGIVSSPLVILLFFVSASVPLIFLRLHEFKYLSKPLMIWCISYVACSFLWLGFFTDYNANSQQDFETRVLSTLLLISLNVIFSKYHIVIKFSQSAILLSLLMHLRNIFLELNQPRIFGDFNLTGRPSGFYQDVNVAGGAFVIGMIFCLDLVPKKLRLPFILSMGLGSFLTFSRGAIFCYFLELVLLIYLRKINFKQLVTYCSIIVLIIFIGGGVIAKEYLQEISMQNTNISERIEWIQDPSSSNANNDTSRFYIVELGWKLYTKNPIVGNGLGITDRWSQPIATHNMYLDLMVNYGFIGAVILPLLLYAIVRKSRGEVRITSILFVTFFATWSFFSHEVLEERFQLTIFSLMAAMTTQSRNNLLSFSGKGKL
ncbi:MAG: O-antigen ligase family protein [Cyanobacteria bacterium P01_A01_bin.45]